MPSTSPCTCFRLRKLGRLMSQHYDRQLAGVGISLNQYSILRRAHERPKAIGELAAELGMDRSTLSRDLKPLLENGWMQYRQASDARQRPVQTSASGRKMIDKAMPLWRRAQDDIEALLGDSQTRRLHRQLDHAIEQLQGRP